MSVDKVAAWIERVEAYIASVPDGTPLDGPTLEALYREMPEAQDPMHDWLWLRLIQIQYGARELATQRAAELLRVSWLWLRPTLEGRFVDLDWPPRGTNVEADWLRTMFPREP